MPATPRQPPTILFGICAFRFRIISMPSAIALSPAAATLLMPNISPPLRRRFRDIYCRHYAAEFIFIDAELFATLLQQLSFFHADFDISAFATFDLRRRHTPLPLHITPRFSLRHAADAEPELPPCRQIS